MIYHSSSQLCTTLLWTFEILAKMLQGLRMLKGCKYVYKALQFIFCNRQGLSKRIQTDGNMRSGLTQNGGLLYACRQEVKSGCIRLAASRGDVPAEARGVISLLRWTDY